MEHKQDSHISLSRRKLLKCGLYGGLSAALSSSLWLCGCAKWRRRKMPNVILISIDTARSDHCSACGYRRDTTPNLRLLAKQATSFTTAYSPSAATGPSHATMLTALYPMEHRVLKNGLKLSQEYKTIAKLLTEHNYQTAAVVSAYVLNSKFGYDQGFSFFDDHIELAQSSRTKTTWAGQKIKGGLDRRANYTTPKVIRWLKEQRDPTRPFFFFLHYWDPHTPYDPPEPFSSQFAQAKQRGGLYRTIALYDGEIAWRLADGTNRDLIKTDNTYNDGSWHHLAVIRTGSGSSNLDIYVDGVDVSTSSVLNQGVGDISNSYDLSIGAKYDAGDANIWENFLNGIIDDVRIYDRALSAEEIWQLYQDGLN